MRLVQFLLVASCSLASAAAQGRLASPTLGYVYDAGRSALRPVLGIPGAALLGEPADAGFPVASAAVSPRQDFALAVSAADQRVRILRFSDRAPSVAEIPGAPAAPDRMVLSPSGRSALLSKSAHLELVTGLPGSPAVKEVDLSATGVPADMAVSDDGAFIVLATAQPQDALWLLAPDAAPVQLPLPPVAAFSFRRDTHDLVAATRSGDIYLSGDAGVRQIYTGDAQTSHPIAVRLSPDASRAYLATAGGSLAVIDIRTASASAISCQCSPTGLDPLASGTIFRVNGVSHRPLWLFDGSAAEPAVWFVPPDQAPRAHGRAAK